MATIQIHLQSNQDQQELCFEQDSITIGRGLGNDILLEDPQVSRYHARLVLEDGALTLYDLRSRNGTRVNSEKISSCPIRGDETIYIGQAMIRVRVEQGSNRAPEGQAGEEYRPTRHHRVSGVVEVSDSGEVRPVETPIIIAEKSTVELDPRPTKTESPAEKNEKDTEAAIHPSTLGSIPNLAAQFSSDEPWRPFENCLGALMPLIRDPQIESITVASTKVAFVKRGTHIEQVGISMSEGQLQEALRIVSASVKPSHSSQASAPAFSIRLSDGAELAGAGPALAPPYGVLVITTAPRKARNMQDFLRDKILSQDMFYFLHGCVALRKTILVSCPQKNAARDLLNVIADCIPANQRVTLLRGYSRLDLPQTQVVNFGEQMSLSAAVLESASRTRPDRLVVAEPLQGDAVRAFVDQVLGGCQGSLAHVRTSSPEAALSKLESAICQSDNRIPYEVVRTLVRESIQLIVQLFELPNGAIRVRSIAEVVRAPSGESIVRPIFEIQQGSSVLLAPRYTTQAPSFLAELELTGFEEAYRGFDRSAV
jgi:Flp pilus assembly CpaF family ATPase